MRGAAACIGWTRVNETTSLLSTLGSSRLLTFMDNGLRDLLDELASKTPAPAAGAVAALSLTQGAAIGLKAVRVTLESRRTETSEKTLLIAAESALIRVIDEGIPKFDEDCRAVRALVARFNAPQDSARNDTSTARPIDDAMLVPMSILSLARDGLLAMSTVAAITKKALICESGASANLMWAAANTCHSILLSNAVWLGGERDWSELVTSAAEARDQALQSYQTIANFMRTTLGD